MSNTAAIPTVSAAFLRRIQSAAQTAIPNAKVRLGPPSAKLSDDGAPLVNLHLFRVEPNAAHSNDHLPSRSATGQLRNPSTLALNLHYIMSFYGDNDMFEPELMLGEVMLAFEHEPALSKATVASAIADNEELEDSDLDKALSRLRVTRQLMTIDDFSKVWSIFYQVPYTLSLAYEVTHVVIESSDARPVPTPIAHPDLWVAPFANLRLDRAGQSADSTFPPVWGGALHVQGQGLGKAELALEADGVSLVMDNVARSETALIIPLDTATFGGAGLTVGVHRLQAIAAKTSADQPDHLRGRSNALAFALAPSIALGAVTAPAGGSTATGSVEITFSPAIQSQQEVRLLLDPRSGEAPTQIVIAGREPADNGADETTLTFNFENVTRARYLARADVDGLLSPVEIDAVAGSPTFGQIIGPELVI